jgi:hypothetical protein
VTGRTFAEVDLLEAFTETTLAALPAAVDAVATYRTAREAARGAPSDLPIELEDRSHEADDLLGTLAVIDQLPAAFAFALRALDTQGFEVRRALPHLRSTTDEDALTAVAFARVEHPYATDGQVLAAGLVGEVPPPLDHEPHPLLDDVVWWGRSVTVADAWRTVVEDELSAIGLRQPPGSPLPDPAVTPRWARYGRPLGRITGPAGYGLPGVEQWLADAGDHNLTEGHRIARSAAASTVDGVGAAFGTAVGGAAGTAVAGPPGALAGAVAGAEVGARAGRQVRGWRHVRTGTSLIGKRLDDLLGSGHDDDYDDRLELEPPR